MQMLTFFIRWKLRIWYVYICAWTFRRKTYKKSKIVLEKFAQNSRKNTRNMFLAFLCIPCTSAHVFHASRFCFIAVTCLNLFKPCQYERQQFFNWLQNCKHNMRYNLIFDHYIISAIKEKNQITYKKMVAFLLPTLPSWIQAFIIFLWYGV